VGKTAIVEEGDPEAIPGAYFIRLRFKKNIAPRFARQVLASEHIQQIIASRSRQSAQQNFSGPGIRDLPLPVPPRKLQNQLDLISGELRARLAKLRIAATETEQLFDSLMHRAFSGGLS
jgi:type I restriction enzyme S subunit